MVTLFFAFVLDLVLGDPVYSFHPVRLMGRGIQAGENFLRRWIPDAKKAGAVLAFVFPPLIFFGTWWVLIFLIRIHFLLGWILNLFLIYSSLSIGDLEKEAIRIYADLRKNDLDNARRHLSGVVGRDTETLDKNGIIRASVETIAESLLDGVLSPLFYAALGGAPAAMAYKAVNTLDSMVGHLDEKYRDFGFWAAKQDEFWNWLPARISCYLIAAGSLFFNQRAGEALFAGQQHGAESSSGNGAIPEAAFAGALGLRLGGPSTYQGRTIDKPFLGFPLKDFDPEDILKAVRLMKGTSWISLLFALALRYAINIVALSGRHFF